MGMMYTRAISTCIRKGLCEKRYLNGRGSLKCTSKYIGTRVETSGKYCGVTSNLLVFFAEAELVNHFQIILPSSKREGRQIKAIIKFNKNGYLFLHFISSLLRHDIMKLVAGPYVKNCDTCVYRYATEIFPWNSENIYSWDGT